MAFNGTENVPEGEMVKSLERMGLAFGADTNASTSHSRTDYRLSLPEVDDETVDYALFLMREVADKMLIEETGEPSGFDWAVNVIDSDQANAFALPGGYSAVYTGLIPIAENEDGLAVVMGHEIAHALAHHGAERMAQQNMQRIVGAGVSLGAGGMDYGAQRAVMGVFGGISQYGYALPFSRKHESEADEIGLWILAKACYDPREAPRLWERMGASAGATPPEFQSTHPAPETRVADFQRWMPKAIEIYNQNCPTKISTLSEPFEKAPS